MKRKVCLNGIKYIDHHGVAHISKDIKSIEDLIELGDIYEPGRLYNIDLKKIYDIKDSLLKLKNMIGLYDIKNTLVNQIIYFLQDFHGEEMLHTVIQGPPGVGKTMLANIIGEIYHKMNIFKTTDDDYKFIVAKRSDMIGEYLGTTAMKTQKVIDKCKGGVLLIDEAYALGNNEGRDSYSKECIDTLNQNLSENKQNFLCIIAGYKNALDSNFFNYNEGLRRRFPFVYTIENYTYNELTSIFYDIFKRDKWVCLRDVRINELFAKKYKEFKNMAGDMETLAFITKMEHSKRVLFLHKDKKKTILFSDIKNGVDNFFQNKGFDNVNDNVMSHIYM
jgi:AAA+ superfamily predicted ATPase